MRIILGLDGKKLIVKRMGSKKINPFILAIGKRKNWIEVGICLGQYNRRIDVLESWYKKVNNFIYTDNKLNGTKRWAFSIRLFAIEISHEIR